MDGFRTRPTFCITKDNMFNGVSFLCTVKNTVLQGEAVIHPVGEGDIVGDHNGGQLPVTAEIMEELKDQLSGTGVEVAGRFIRQQK